MPLIGKGRGHERVLNCCFGSSARIIPGTCHRLQKGRKNERKAINSPEG
jgi:hypothetical protein